MDDLYGGRTQREPRCCQVVKGNRRSARRTHTCLRHVELSIPVAYARTNASRTKSCWAQLAEVSRALGRSHHLHGLCGGRVHALSLVVHKEKQPLFDYGSAKSASESVVPKSRSWNTRQIVAPLIGIQCVISEEFKGTAMVRIRARLDCRIDDTTQKIPKLRRRSVGDQIELLDGLDTRRVRDFIVVALIVIDPVQDVVVCLLPITVDIGATHLKRVLTRSKRPRIRAYGPGREKSELIVVSSNQRNIFRDDVIDMSANVGGVRLKQRRRASYFDALRHGAYGHLHIDSRNLAQDELKGRAHRSLEPLRFYLQFISSDRDMSEVVHSLGIGLCFISSTARSIPSGDLSACNERTARIGNRSGNGRRHPLTLGA